MDQEANMSQEEFTDLIISTSFLNTSDPISQRNEINLLIFQDIWALLQKKKFIILDWN